MNDVRLDPQQAPARAELLLGAGFGREAPGRPIHGRLESEDNGAGDPGPRLRLGAVRTRRLAASEAAATPSGSAYGNPLRGTRDDAPAVPIGAPFVATSDVPDAHGWRVYRVAPDGTVIYDGWIEHDPANAELALAELRAAVKKSPATALRQAVERQPGHASEEAITRWLAAQATERRSAPVRPRSRAARRRWRRALARKGGRASLRAPEPTSAPRASSPGNASSGTASARCATPSCRRSSPAPTAAGPPTRCRASAGRCRPCPRRAPATSRASIS